MNSLNFIINPQITLVADASVVININATGRSYDILTALPNHWVVTENTLNELIVGTRHGHNDAHKLKELIDAGVIELVQLGTAASSIYETLVDGSAQCTLDDGEAATMAYAHEVGGIALIDERKARNLCVRDFPTLALASTVDIFLHEAVTKALGQQSLIDAFLSALQIARMRVPHNRVARVVALIGEARAASCVSLPRAARTHGLAQIRQK